MLSAALRLPDVHDDDPDYSRAGYDYDADRRVFEVATMARVYWRGTSLRQAWEAQCYLEAAGYCDAMLTCPADVDLDFDGLSLADRQEVETWNFGPSGEVVSVHTCIAPGGVP